MSTKHDLPRLSRQEIDQWPVATAGFCARVVHGMEREGVATVGELRQWPDERLLRMRNFGAITLKNVRWFYQWTRRLESGEYHLASYRVFLREFLDRSQVYVLEHRYELHNRLYRPWMRSCTLQQIARMMGGLTRERVRQVESTGLAALRTQLCRAVGASIASPLARRMDETGGVVDAEGLRNWVGNPLLGKYQPWGVMVLISDTMESIHYRSGCFYTFPAKTLQRLEKCILPRLQQSADPVPFDQLREVAAGELGELPGREAKVVRALLDHHPLVSATRDGRYFLPSAGGGGLIAEVMKRKAGPLHFHEVTRLYNEQVVPRNQVGPGSVLRLLNLAPAVEKVERSVYRHRHAAGAA